MLRVCSSPCIKHVSKKSDARLSWLSTNAVNMMLNDGRSYEPVTACDCDSCI